MSLGIEDVISRERVCAIIGISADTLRRWIKERDFPEPLQASGRAPIFDKKMVSDWIANHEKHYKSQKLKQKPTAR